MATAIQTMPLLAPEQVGPKGWTRDMICLELAEDYNFNKITSILQTAWSSFKQRVPMVGMEGVPVGDNVKPAGLLKLQAYKDGEIADFVIKDHRSDESVLSFAALKAQNFPNAAMDNEKMCMRGRWGEWPTPGVDRLATNMMQANLIKGGLLLNHLCFHAFMDGTSMWKLMQAFAEDVRRAQGLPIDQPVEFHVADREKLLNSTGDRVCKNFAQEHPEFVHLPFTPDAMPDGLVKVPHHAHTFRFTPESLKALKAECSPANIQFLKTQLPADQIPAYISTNDALTALLWRTVQRAENPDPSALPDKPTIIQLALDIRRRAHHPVHPHTLGNIIGWAMATVPLSALHSASTTLADLACLIRISVARCANDYYDELAHYVENIDDVNRLAGTAFLDVPKSNVLQSNWSQFDYYGIEWGEAFGGKTKALRFAAGGVCAGFQGIIPCSPDAPEGSMEMLVDASDEAWSHLLADETWNRFAINPTTTVYE